MNTPAVFVLWALHTLIYSIQDAAPILTPTYASTGWKETARFQNKRDCLIAARTLSAIADNEDIKTTNDWQPSVIAHTDMICLPLKEKP